MKQLGILDSAFINMEHKNVPQHIGSFGIYDQSTAPGGKVRFKSVINHFQHQIKRIPLFRTRLIQSPGSFARPYWLVDDDLMWNSMCAMWPCRTLATGASCVS